MSHREISMVVKTSYPDLNAISKKRQNSLFDELPAPSAIFNGIDVAERHIWLINPYRSSGGKFALT